jgi:hypothetical protein
MTPEERFERIERHVEFLAENQAGLTASVGMLKQDLVELARIVQQHVVSTETRFQMVADRFERVTGQFERVNEAIESLAKAQRMTEERLNALVMVVERYFSNGKH